MSGLNYSNLDCPQYVNFEDFINGDVNSPSSSSLIDNSMVTDDQKSLTLTTPKSLGSRNLRSPCSDIDGQSSPGGYSLRSTASKENYPVIYLNNSKFPRTKGKTISKNEKTASTESFRIRADPKRKREDEHIPLAELVKNFHKKTPERFHSHGSKAFQPSKHISTPELTIPVSPYLQAAKRARGTSYLSQEEKEAIEVEEMKRYKFRARPVPDGILQRRQSLKAAKNTPTKPQNIQTRSAQRATQSASISQIEEKPYKFRARPVPATVLNGPTGIKEKTSAPVTEPKTPNFQLKKRAEKWKSHNHSEEIPEAFKANPVPAFDTPFEVKAQKTVTEIQPFSFDRKDKERMTQKEKKIAEEIRKESQVFEFKAQPMPSATPSKLPAVPKKPATHPEPFHFISEELTSNHIADTTSDQLCVNFKAQPAKVLQKPPFIPEKPERQALEFKEFNLHTDIRASEWQKIKEINAIKEQQKMEALQRQKQLQEEEEKREIARIRREAVHKAQPIPVFKPFEVKPSSRTLTEPKSPRFHIQQRLQKKQG